MKDADRVLIAWLFTTLLWDCFIWAFFMDMVFWRGYSGWWFLLAIAITNSPALLKALKKRFELEKK